MLLYPNSKVYIICAGGVFNDSVEHCHRLASRLIRLGVDIKIIYVPVTENFDPEKPVHPACKPFRVPYTYDLEDSKQNILIVPETFTSFLYSVKNIRRVIWWLSVDNLFRDVALRAVSHFDHLLTAPMAKFFCFQKCDDDVEHWTQSEYSKLFLKVNKVRSEKMYHIGDFISPTLIKLHKTIDFKRKKNLVVYNAATSSKIMQQLIDKMSDVEWAAIQETQAVDAPKLLADAKIYVDFGDFPTYEIMPRRAAVLGCVVITGKHGAAANDVDINIPHDFKFDDAEKNLPAIEKKIRAVLADHKSAYAKQKNFLKKILDEQKKFNRNIAMTLGIKAKTDSEPAAIFNGVHEMGAAVAEILLKNEVGLDISFVVNDNLENEKNPALTITHINGESALKLKGGQTLPIITTEDARFLYNEGRIKKFILLTSDKLEEDFVKQKINPLKEDIISTNFDE